MNNKGMAGSHPVSRHRMLFVSMGFLVTAGMLISAYLLYLHISARLGMPGGGLCSVLGGGCSEAIRSSWSSLLGIPLAAWGLIFYIVLLTHVVVHRLAFGRERPPVTGFAVLLGLGAALAGLFLLVMMLSDAVVFCPLCFFIHLINIALLFVLYRLTGSTVGALLQRGKTSLAEFLGGEGKLDIGRRFAVTGVVLAFAIGVVFFEWVLIIEQDLDARALKIDEQHLMQALMQQPREHIPIHAGDPMLGDSSAAIKVVVFSDFHCPACAVLAIELMKLEALFGSDAVLIFKHLPLDTECNPMLDHNMHPGACDAARASEAARLQGKFWAFHDALFLAGSDREDPDFVGLAESIGCDVDRFRREMSSAETKNRISRSIALAQELEIAGTPTVFINGRRVGDSRPRAVHAMIERTLFDLRRFRAIVSAGDTTHAETPESQPTAQPQ